jgi:hypothetical protein
MKRNTRAFLRPVLLCRLLLSLAAPAVFAQQDTGLVARWTFDEGAGASALDQAGGLKDAIQGHFKFVPGIAGTGLKFDGYTTRVVREGSKAPRLGDAFTMEAWVAMASLPWNWCPVVSQEKDGMTGVSFGVGPKGEFGLKVSVRGEWVECISPVRIAVKKWAHIAATFEAGKGITIFLDGKEVASTPVTGSPAYAGRADLLIGMNPEKRKPSDIVGGGAGTIEGWYAFDGIMDDIRIYNRIISPAGVKQAYDSLQPVKTPDLPARHTPSGPPGPGRFGAYYTKLSYDESWDALWPVGPAADIVVQFDNSPIRVVFWRGTRYGPAWVMENGQWMADQSMETTDAAEGCYEHMEDPRCLYSNVRVLESTEARVVVHWRYAAVSSRNHIARVDDKSGWGLWIDEYYYFYPDQTAVRKMVWNSETLGNAGWEIQETTPICQPGQNTDDILNPDAITILNLKGESQVYSWPGEMNNPGQWKNVRPENPNIQVVNTKSKSKPFMIFEPGCRMHVYVGRIRKNVSDFSAYNHFPVSLLPSDGRYAVSSDKVTSFSISYTDPPRHIDPASTTWASWIYGVVEGKFENLATVGRSWVNAPKLDVRGAGVVSNGYDLSQRAYVLTCREAGKPAAVEGELNASPESPLVNAALIVKGWGDGGATLKIDGKPAVRGRDFRTGSTRTLEGTDLIVWIKTESTRPVKFVLSPQ